MSSPKIEPSEEQSGGAPTRGLTGSAPNALFVAGCRSKVVPTARPRRGCGDGEAGTPSCSVSWAFSSIILHGAAEVCIG